MMLTISKVAREVGVTPDALRFYEREGLVAPPERTSSRYRVYAPDVAERIRLIKGAQRLGLRLREIRELLDARDRGLCPCGHTEAMIRARIAEVDREQERLAGVRAELERMLGRLPGECEDASSSPWPCEREFIEMGRAVR